jgi:hypothetical protein
VLGPAAAWRSAVIPWRHGAIDEGTTAAGPSEGTGPLAECRPGVWVRRVRVLRGRRCCAGCSPWTSFSARAAAAGRGSWACTPGVRACASCWSGSGSTARRRRANRRGHRRERESRTLATGFPRPGASGPLAVVCLPPAFGLRPRPAPSHRG